MAWLPDGEALHARSSCRADGRLRLRHRWCPSGANARRAVPRRCLQGRAGRLLQRIEALLGLGRRALRYADKRRAQHRAMKLAGDASLQPSCSPATPAPRPGAALAAGRRRAAQPPSAAPCCKARERATGPTCARRQTGLQLLRRRREAQSPACSPITRPARSTRNLRNCKPNCAAAPTAAPACLNSVVSCGSENERHEACDAATGDRTR